MRIKDKLKELDHLPKKSRGQNFLIDQSVIKDIVAFGDPKKGEKLVEIGPGLGALTQELVPFGNLTVIEIEDKFCNELKAKYPTLDIINSDVREVDFSEIGEELVVFGNLPYSFSTDIIFHLITFSQNINRAVIMLQREFAQRLAAKPGGKDYAVLTISCQLSCNVRLGKIIPGNSFHPPTEVESQLVELTFPKTPPYQVDDIFWLKRVVSAAFMMRRKMIKNSLKASKVADGDVIDRALAASGIDPMRRAETVSINEFIGLATALKPKL